MSALGNKFKNFFSPQIQKISIGDNEMREQWRSVFSKIGLGNYSDAIVKMVLSPIFDELKKVEFYAEDSYSKKLEPVVNFLNNNYATLYKILFTQGFAALKVDKGIITFDHLAYLNKTNNFEVSVSNPISVKTFELDFFSRSLSDLMSEFLENINTGLTAQKAMTRTLGQFTFFSKAKEGVNERIVPLTDAERKNFEDKFNKIFSGTDVGASVYFTNANLKRDTVQFPLASLGINENVSFCILILAGMMNVPYDLIPISGKSTFANQEEAIEYLRTHTVSGIAENFLELGRKAAKSISITIPNKALDYRIIIDTNEHGKV